MENQRTGVLLINLGTPDDATPRAVYRYLKEFLSDERVLDINPTLRWMLLNFVILPFRSFSSAHAYKTVWTKEGSPLLVHTKNLKQELQKVMPSNYIVEFAMRYANPSIKNGIAALLAKNCAKLIVIPLFPQYASATTGSVIQKVNEELSKYNNIPEIIIKRDFYKEDGFINPIVTILKSKISEIECEHILFSYHGLPVRHVEKSDLKKCDQSKPCPEISLNNQFCYKAQCYATSRAIGEKIDIEYSTSFQSRLGRTPWIQPYTDEILQEIRNKNIKHLAVACPSFVADCLETIEEIGMRLREDWHALGGETLTLIPCLNAHPSWVDGLKDIIFENKKESITERILDVKAI